MMSPNVRSIDRQEGLVLDMRESGTLRKIQIGKECFQVMSVGVIQDCGGQLLSLWREYLPYTLNPKYFLIEDLFEELEPEKKIFVWVFNWV
jgi:hypothetical protein